MGIELQPFVGPRPFERDEEAIFFGRDHEGRDLLSLVVAHGEVLFYGQSGAGKTSLINARLIPLLEKRRFEVLAPARVKGIIQRRMQPKNDYMFNVLMSLEKGAVGKSSMLQLSLTDYLKKREQTADKARKTVPRVVIFDQFEDFFSFYPKDSEQKREDFFRQVTQALEADPLLRVLFVIREEFLANLDRYAHLLPERLRTHYRMERLRPKEARDAVEKPLQNIGRSFAEGVASKLVEQLLTIRVERATGETVEVAGEYVEPVQLQIVCLALWKRVQKDDIKVITAKHLEFVDVDKALIDFYEIAVEAAVKKTDIQEWQLRKWFENKLITTTGTRGMVHRESKETGGIPNAAVDELVQQHLIRAESRAGARWYELTHDRLIEPVQRSNKKWFSKLPEAGQTRQRLEARAAEWVRLGRGSKGLLDEVEVFEAERWLESPGAAELGYSETLLALVKSSQANAEQKRADEKTRIAKRLWRLTVALVVVFLVAVGAAVFAWKQKQDADRRAVEAHFAKADAEYTKILLDVEKAQAERYKSYANKYSEKAEEKELIARQNEQNANSYVLTAAGIIYTFSGEYEEGKKQFEDAISLNPDNDLAHSWLGFIYLEEKLPVLAIGEFKEVIKIISKIDKPDALLLSDYARAHNMLGDAYKLKGSGYQDQAKEMYRMSGIIYFDFLFNYQEAYETFKKIYELNPKSRSDTMNFAEANLATGRFEEAYNLAQKVLDSSESAQPSNIDGQLAMRFIKIASLVLEGDTNKTRKELKEFISYYKNVIDDYKPEWSYNGSKHFIEQRDMEEKHRELLLKLIGILQTPTPDITIEQFYALL